MVPLACQYVVIPDQNIVLVDGLFACKGIITGPNTSLTIPPQAFLSVDNRGEPAGLPAYIQGLLDINGKWEVR